MATDAANDAESAVTQAKALLQQGRLQQAAEAAEAALAREADHAEALYILAVCQRYLKQPAAAQETLDRLKNARPGYGRAFQEEGHIRRDAGETEAALAAYEQAVQGNPGLGASWKALAELYRETGQGDAAERAQAQFQRLSALPPELVSVTSFMHEGKLMKAEQLCRSFLQKHPHHLEAMRLLAQLGLRLGVLDDAEFLLESALEFDPDFVLARIDYVEALHKRQKYAEALEQAKILLRTDPDNPAFKSLYANQAMAVGDYDAALGTYDAVLTAMPDNPQIHLARGHALKTVGRQDEAIEAYRGAHAAKPDFGDAYWSLANLKTYRFGDDELAAMQAQEDAAGIALEDRFHLCFALGKAYEDRGDYEQSFKFYERGNALKKRQTRYKAEDTEAEFARQKAACAPELFADKAGMGADAPDPIFIVGLPRAGSTLLEQILASHSQVDGTLELPNILALAHRLNGRRKVTDEPRYPGILSELSAEQLEELGQKYIEDTRIYREGAPFFTDKMPNNFRHIGLIRLILPNARIIDARRDPMACCFSGFKQLFAEGQEFTYGLDEIGRYYRGYVELMDHWDEAAPGEILRVRYEDVVDDLEGEVRRILDFCGLEFEESCVNFHETDRAVRTASSEQVRQPINRKGVEQWRHFEPWLDPLKAALGPVLERETR